MVLEQARKATGEQKDVDQKGEEWHVVEYCCEHDSLQSEWFARKGHGATRLGLLEWDLSTEAAARRVVSRAEE
eukprot:12135365-Heterocapsa_arctica.AAC.1